MSRGLIDRQGVFTPWSKMKELKALPGVGPSDPSVVDARREQREKWAAEGRIRGDQVDGDVPAPAVGETLTKVRRETPKKAFPREGTESLNMSEMDKKKRYEQRHGSLKGYRY